MGVGALAAGGGVLPPVGPAPPPAPRNTFDTDPIRVSEPLRGESKLLLPVAVTVPLPVTEPAPITALPLELVGADGFGKSNAAFDRSPTDIQQNEG